ncbi:DUF445 domain-containing protein, partial [Achromobacter xylosoxidans]|nr:DUF445 domain-containing protein [Achromobacter xylosoxidans]
MTDTPQSASPSAKAFITRSALASQARRTQLRRMKIAALALLVAMISGFITSHLMGGQG